MRQERTEVLREPREEVQQDGKGNAGRILVHGVVIEEVLQGHTPVRIPLTAGQHLDLEPLKAVLHGFRRDVLRERPSLQLRSLRNPHPGPAAALIDAAGTDGVLEVGKRSRDQAAPVPPTDSRRSPIPPPARAARALAGQLPCATAGTETTWPRGRRWE